MDTTAALAYRRGSLARCRVLEPDAGTDLVDRPELHGFLPSTDHRRVRLVVTDDAALPALTAAMPLADTGIVGVVDTATACVRYLRTLPDWRDSPATAMAQPDLTSTPAVPWPHGLHLRPVRRTADDAAGGVPLADAVALLDAGGPGRPEARAGLVHHLAGLPATTILAAVDDDGVVRATAGSGVFGTDAHVVFVNTHPAWRRRGVAAAMTAATLADAAAAGATAAFLDASTDGQSPYARLGFVPVATTARFARY